MRHLTEISTDLLAPLQSSTLPSEQRTDTSAWRSPAEVDHLLYIKGGAEHPYCASPLLRQSGGQTGVQGGWEGEVRTSGLCRLQKCVSIL